MSEQYRIILFPYDPALKPVMLKGDENRRLTLEEAESRCSKGNPDANSRTAIGRAGTVAYRYNRRFPKGWFLGFGVE